MGDRPQMTDSAPLTSSLNPDINVERLLHIDRTAVIEAELQRYRVALESIPPALADVRNKAYGMIAALETKLDLAHQRDTIAASRPDGCWCLGSGGSNQRYVPDLDGGGTPVFDRTCSCPEGRAEEARKQIEIDHYRSNIHGIRARGYFNQAAVPHMFSRCSFETYPVSADTKQALAAVKAWVSDGWAQGSEAGSGRVSLLLYGSYGVGKTGLAVSAMREMSRELQMPALFLTTPDLLDRIRSTYNRDSAESEKDLVQAVKDIDLLVLDDLGAERPTDWVRERLFTIINHRHDECMPTIFTSNLDPKMLAEHLGERTAWRIVEMSTVIHVTGQNIRDRKSQ